MKLTVATLALCNALAPAPQRPPQTRRALLAKSGIAALSLAGPLVALPEAANAGRLQDMAAAREAKKGGGKKAAAAPKARRPRQKIKSYEDAVAGSMAPRIVYTDTHNHSRRRPRATAKSRRRRPRRRCPRSRRAPATSTRPSPSCARRSRPARTCPRLRSLPHRNKPRSSRGNDSLKTPRTASSRARRRRRNRTWAAR